MCQPQESCTKTTVDVCLRTHNLGVAIWDVSDAPAIKLGPSESNEDEDPAKERMVDLCLTGRRSGCCVLASASTGTNAEVRTTSLAVTTLESAGLLSFRRTFGTLSLISSPRDAVVVNRLLKCLRLRGGLCPAVNDRLGGCSEFAPPQQGPLQWDEPPENENVGRVSPV